MQGCHGQYFQENLDYAVFAGYLSEIIQQYILKVLMQVTKRNGTTEPYNREKIAVAIRKSFASTGREAADDTIQKMVHEVESFVRADATGRSVERIHDEVER